MINLKYNLLEPAFLNKILTESIDMSALQNFITMFSGDGQLFYKTTHYQ